MLFCAKHETRSQTKIAGKIGREKRKPGLCARVITSTTFLERQNLGLGTAQLCNKGQSACSMLIFRTWLGVLRKPSPKTQHSKPSTKHLKVKPNQKVQTYYTKLSIFWWKNEVCRCIVKGERGVWKCLKKTMTFAKFKPPVSHLKDRVRWRIMTSNRENRRAQTNAVFVKTTASFHSGTSLQISHDNIVWSYKVWRSDVDMIRITFLLVLQKKLVFACCVHSSVFRCVSPLSKRLSIMFSDRHVVGCLCWSAVGFNQCRQPTLYRPKHARGAVCLHTSTHALWHQYFWSAFMFMILVRCLSLSFACRLSLVLFMHRPKLTFLVLALVRVVARSTIGMLKWRRTRVTPSGTKLWLCMKIDNLDWRILTSRNGFKRCVGVLVCALLFLFVFGLFFGGLFVVIVKLFVCFLATNVPIRMQNCLVHDLVLLVCICLDRVVVYTRYSFFFRPLCSCRMSLLMADRPLVAFTDVIDSVNCIARVTFVDGKSNRTRKYQRTTTWHRSPSGWFFAVFWPLFVWLGWWFCLLGCDPSSDFRPHKPYIFGCRIDWCMILHCLFSFLSIVSWLVLDFLTFLFVLSY